MHPYATNSKERITIALLIAIVSVFFAWGLSSFIDTWSLNQYTKWLEIPSVWGFYFLLYNLFKKYLWKWKTFKFIINTPNINGKWKGFVESSRDDFKTKHPVSIKIQQNWTQISIMLETDKSISKSDIAGLLIATHNESILTYSYHNEPKGNAPKKMNQHRGSSRVIINKGINEIKGDYYNGRGRKSYGIMELEKIK